MVRVLKVEWNTLYFMLYGGESACGYILPQDCKDSYLLGDNSLLRMIIWMFVNYC